MTGVRAARCACLAGRTAPHGCAARWYSIAATKRAVTALPRLQASHEHVYDRDKEVYDAERDVWSNACTSCGHTCEYEKL
jgi:hypothetical protein